MRWRYWITPAIAGPLTLGLGIATCRSLDWAGRWLLGFALWTLAEYWTHRLVLHWVYWFGVHERHHTNPEEFVEALWWGELAFFAAMLAVMPAGLFVGFMSGYLLFVAMHHWMHHRPLKPGTLMYRYARWHGLHHKFGNCNYGITQPFWDYVFLTAR